MNGHHKSYFSSVYNFIPTYYYYYYHYSRLKKLITS
jgi:hypothetical protein